MTARQRNNLIVGVFILTGAILLLMYIKGCRDASDPTLIHAPDTIRSVNKAGDSTFSLKGREIDFSVIERHLADSIADVYGTKVKNLQEVIIAQVKTIADLQAISPVDHDFFPPDTSHADCPPKIKNLRQTFSSPYYTARVQIGDSSYLHLTGNDTITTLWKHVREGNIFHRKHLIQLDISLADTSRHITGLMAYRMPEKKPKKFGIGPAVVEIFDGTKFRTVVGVGLTYTLIRF